MISLDFSAVKEDRQDNCEFKTAFWTFIRSQRGAPLIIHSGSVYRCERKIGNKTYWLCIRYKGHKCNARLIIRGNTLLKSTDHNHATDERSAEQNIEEKNLADNDIDEWIKGNSRKAFE